MTDEPYDFERGLQRARAKNGRRNKTAAVIAWGQVLGAPVMPKLMWENAARFFRLTSTPWSNHEG